MKNCYLVYNHGAYCAGSISDVISHLLKIDILTQRGLSRRYLFDKEINTHVYGGMIIREYTDINEKLAYYINYNEEESILFVDTPEEIDNKIASIEAIDWRFRRYVRDGYDYWDGPEEGERIRERIFEYCKNENKIDTWEKYLAYMQGTCSEFPDDMYMIIAREIDPIGGYFDIEYKPAIYL